jgi:hypothetical protein
MLSPRGIGSIRPTAAKGLFRIDLAAACYFDISGYYDAFGALTSRARSRPKCVVSRRRMAAKAPSED